MEQTTKKILAIIPARGGSKRFPRKNVRLLAGQPLIAHTIRHALESAHINKVVVSTDDQEIAEVSKIAGVQIIERPKELAGDESPTHQAVEHVLGHLAETEQYVPDVVVLLQPTSPLRIAQDIDQAMGLFLKNTCESVVSISESGKPNGAVYISTPAHLETYKSFYTKQMLHYVMPKERSVDIDQEEDFRLAESLIQKS